MTPTGTDTTPSAQTLGTRLRWQLSDTIVLAHRNLAHVRQVPEKLIDVTAQPLMFMLLLAFVFGGSIHIRGGSYHEYLVGGIFIQTLTFGMAGPGCSIATDLTEGIIDRFRSLPMSRSAYLLGHLTAEFIASTLAVIVLTVAGLAVGWRIHTDLIHAAAGFALLALLAFVMLWVGTLVGILVRSPDAVMGIAFVIIFPLAFLSNAFVPAAGLPSGLRAFAEYNPVSAFAAATRTLFGNPTATPANPSWPLQHPVLSATLWSVALLAITIALTLSRFHARTTG